MLSLCRPHSAADVGLAPFQLSEGSCLPDCCRGQEESHPLPPTPQEKDKGSHQQGKRLGASASPGRPWGLFAAPSPGGPRQPKAPPPPSSEPCGPKLHPAGLTALAMGGGAGTRAREGRASSKERGEGRSRKQKKGFPLPNVILSF